MRRWVSLILVLLVGAASAAQSPADTVTIDLDSVISDVSPHVFGANFGTLNTVPLELREQALASGVTYLRFPGGRVGDLGDVTNFQIDLFMGICRMMECTPAISTRLENGTPEKAAEMVRYVNITKGYGVKYWSVGNEADLFDDYTAEQAAEEWRVIALAMLEVDPEIILIGPDTSQFTGIDGSANQRAHEFLDAFLALNSDMVDIVSVHRYPFGNPSATFDGLREDAKTWAQLIQNLHDKAREALGRDVPVAITEANSHWSSVIGQAATPDSFPAALWWADVFGQLLEGDVEIVAYFNFQTSDRLGGQGLLAAYGVRPTYYVYTLYKQFGKEMLATDVDGAVRAYAARRDDGAITAMLINWEDSETTVNLEIPGLNSVGASIEISDFTEADNVVTSSATLEGDSLSQTLQPRSVRLIVINEGAQ